MVRAVDGPIEIVDTEWWLHHMDELVAALQAAAELPEHEAAISPWWASRVTIVSPQWALDHPDELRAGLEEASLQLGREPERSVEEFLDRAEPPDRERDDEGHEL